MAGLYLHIPFCKQACHYCDFHFSVNREHTDEVVGAIASELQIQRNYLGQDEISTVYFGGGTPSLLSASHLGKIFDSIHKNLNVNPQAEITLEANPDDLMTQKILDLKQIGINRLSIGIQSFDDKVLRFLNRAHDAERSRQSLDAVRQHGFNNINVDLIYSIPGQNEAALLKEIAEALAFSPEHISAYSLTIEEKTVFGKWLKMKKLQPVEEDLSAQQFETLMDQLERRGYMQYEISNFSKPGMISKHNSNYWKGEKYLGIGPSAHSFNKESRQFNVKNNASYVKSINRGVVPFELELLTRENRINELIYTSLRTQWGCDTTILEEKFDYNLLSESKNYIDQLIAEGYVQLDNQVLTLLRPGKLIADKIAMELFLPV
jgi:oxygen-independent coproporphyrinogen-3 oxidase